MSTNGDDMLGLIAKLEAATGPSRELDAEIAVAVDGGKIVWRQANYTMEQYPARQYASAGHIGGVGFAPIPEYTASLDAALGLVPDGAYWHVERRDTPLGKFTAEATVHNGKLFMSGKRKGVDVWGHTPALALCIAALQARGVWNG